jgi:hypothetical protein
MAPSKTYRLFGVRFTPRNLRQKGSGYLVVDLIMLFLVSVNITLFVFYWIYDYSRVRVYVAEAAPEVHAVLNPLYEEFPLIDLIFVSIFLSEFTMRWIIAIWRKTYHRWFFFPFIYWYDLLGSLPFGSFRFLRILRIFALLHRLNKMRVLDVRDTYFYTRYQKYRAILVEEVSDRVVLNVLAGLQKEVREGLPVTDRIFNQVLEPYRPVLIQWVSQRLRAVLEQSHARYRVDLEQYFNHKVHEAVSQNAEMAQLRLVPVVGPQVARTLESAIQDITFNVVNGMFADMAREDQEGMLDEISVLVVDTVLKEDSKPQNEAINNIMQRIVLESIDVVKSHVRVQEWKLRTQARAEGFSAVAEPMEGDPDQETQQPASLRSD